MSAGAFPARDKNAYVNAVTDADPYRNLEDGTSPATIAWTAAQNARTRAILDAIPGRAALEARFDALTRIGTLGVPHRRGRRAFYTARRGGADQPTLYVREGDAERAIVDLGALDASGLTALDWWYPSPRGTFVAFGLSRGGDERSTLHVLDVATGERRGAPIPDTRHCSLAWWPREDGFFYTRYPRDGSYDMRLHAHALDADGTADPVVFGEGRKPEEWIAASLSASGEHLVVAVLDGWTRTDVYVARATVAPLVFETVVEGRDASYDPLAGDDRLFVRTNEGAPRFRVFSVAYDALARDAWHEIVPEGAASLDGFALCGSGLVLHDLVDARSALRVRAHDGTVRPVDALAGRTVLEIDAVEHEPEATILHASILDAPSVVATDGLRTQDLSWARVASPFDASRYRSVQEWCVSPDGTRVPLTVVSRADLPRDGTAPAVLYGYGGFNVSLVPTFSPSIVPWLDAGGVYAIANLRGGGEFGDAWHRAGMRERKQNVFDDAIAAIAYLGTSDIADPARIGIMGGSNGGLLVAAIVTQRPELVRAVVCLVPLTDMLRFPKFLIARLWIAEYGDPADPADAAFLRAYSPYHNVRDGVAYPAMLVATAAADGRVDPMHAKKFGARVQAATSGDAPILVYVEADAGHGAGKPRRKVAAELADRWSFLGWRLGQMPA